MQKTYHEQLTHSALAGAFSPAALEVILAANLGQDALLNLLKSEFHFDANAFDKAHLYLEEQEVALLSDLRRSDPRNAWRAFGRITHAVQDFYAHTNYVALWVERNPGYEPDAGRPVDPLDPDILNSARLIAARVYYPLEALTILPALVPLLQRHLPADSHANMNLDDPGRGPFFPLAMSAAEERTRRCSEAIRGRIREELGEAMSAVFHDL